MRPVVLLSRTKRQIRGARKYYAAIDERLALDLETEINRLLELLEASPYVGSPYRGVYRKLVLSRFPYNLFYYLTDSAIKVVALAHHKRRPDYWMD